MDASHTVAARPSGIATVVGQIRAERRRLILLRLSFVGVVVLYLLLLAWVTPWIPFGMRTADYTRGTAVALLLALSSSLSSLTFLVVWAPHFRQETLPEFLRVLFGAQQLIRGRSQFQSRLAAECHRARRDRRHVFSLIVVRLQAATPQPVAQADGHAREGELTTMLVRSIVRAQDIVSYSWPDEVWVLALGANHQACESIVHRLTRALTASDTPLRSPESCRIGCSTFDLDGQEPDELFSAAYGRMKRLERRVQTAFASTL